MRSLLTSLQRELLEAFFANAHDTQFFLTGGAALAGFYFGHRTTNDLDLFVTSGELDDGEAALRAAASDVGASLEKIRSTPSFRRWLARRNDEGVVVDLVVDSAGEKELPKRAFGTIRVDPPDEILANKLCAVLSRAELRDLVDVHVLEKGGARLEDAILRAQEKDAGLTPGQLAWVLSETSISEQASVPGDVLSPTELRDYLTDLQQRLARMAFPGQ